MIITLYDLPCAYAQNPCVENEEFKRGILTKSILWKLMSHSARKEIGDPVKTIMFKSVLSFLE